MKKYSSFMNIFLSLALVSESSMLTAEADQRWTLDMVADMAIRQRLEITAASERAQAALARPDIVAALEDPMISSAVDHYPFDEMNDASSMSEDPSMDPAELTSAPLPANSDRRYDWSINIEQRFPLSSVRSYRRQASQADATKSLAEVDRTRLDIQEAAEKAFFMLQERRRLYLVAGEQIQLLKELAAAANARYSSGSGSQSEVLRTEVEIANLDATRLSLGTGIRAAEIMLNTSLGQSPGTLVPELVSPDLDIPPPSAEEAMGSALQKRPELQIANAEIDRTQAEVKVMRSMYTPMAMVRLGYASTMAEGSGAMAMVGVSLPIWRTKLGKGVAEAQAMENMAHADRRAMTLMVEGDTLAAREELEASYIRYQALQKDVLPRARRLIQPTLAAYTSGQGSLAAVIEAYQAQWLVQEQFVMAESTLGFAWARLNRMTAKGQELVP
jgi:outer membrane protein, heavy metal efflux system